jgi:hypothetical protein
MDRTLRPLLERLESRDTPAFTSLQPFGKFVQSSVVAVADLNGDGYADSVVGQSLNTLGTPSVSVLLGDGDGAFNQVQDITNGAIADPQSIVLSDVNGDGHLDLIVASFQGVTGGGTTVFLGQADGSFNAVPSFTDLTPSIAVGVADFTGDGKPDIVAINPDNGILIGGYTIFAGDGGGGFSTFDAQSNLPLNVPRVLVGDFDNDGNMDFAAFDQSDRELFTFYGDGAGKFALPAPGFIGLGEFPQDAALGDFNADGLPDLVIVSDTGIRFHQNLGGRQFDPTGVVLLNSSGASFRITAADLNNDGSPDIVATDLAEAHVFYSGANGKFTEDPSSPIAIGAASNFNDPGIGDINGDGNPDFIVARRLGSGSDGRPFINLAPVLTSTIITANPNPITVGNPTTLSATVNYPGRPFPFGTTPGGTMTFEVDGAFFGTAPIVNGVATLPATLALGTHTVLARFPAGGSFQASTSESIPVFVIPPGGEGDGTTYSFEVTGLPTLPGLGADRVASGEFTGDFIRDIALASGPGRPAELSIIDGKSRVEITSVAPFGDGFTGGLMVAAGDIDGDGADDVAVAADIGGGPRVTLYLVKNGGLEITNNFFALDDSFRGGLRIALGDVNGDGLADLVVTGGPGAGPRVATYDGETLTDFQTPQRLFNDFFAMDPNSRLGLFVAVGDVNGDGRADIAVGSDFGGAPRVLMFDGQSMLDDDPEAIADFFAGDPNSRGGVRIALRDVTPSNEGIELLAGDGPTAGSTVRVYSAVSIIYGNDTDPMLTSEILPGYFGGVFVA